MNLKRKMCVDYFNELVNKLKDTHVLLRSCNKDDTKYLVPIGTEEQVTYHSKPKDSYRISDHWNWYSNIKRNKDEDYIQCWNVDLKRCNPRIAEGKASEPIRAWCVGYFGDDERYHTIYGEKFIETEDKWIWREGVIKE